MLELNVGNWETDLLLLSFESYTSMSERARDTITIDIPPELSQTSQTTISVYLTFSWFALRCSPTELVIINRFEQVFVRLLTGHCVDTIIRQYFINYSIYLLHV